MVFLVYTAQTHTYSGDIAHSKDKKGLLCKQSLYTSLNLYFSSNIKMLNNLLKCCLCRFVPMYKVEKENKTVYKVTGCS